MKAHNFESFKDFFDFYLEEKSKNRNGRKKTLQELTEKLGYSSASSLSMLANGARLPSHTLLEGLFDIWSIPSVERDRLRLLVEIERKQKKGQKTFHLQSKFNQISPYQKFNLKQHLLIRHWHNLVVKILVDTPGFQENPTWISQKLRRKISPTEAKKSLELLIESELVVRDSATQKLSTADPMTETTHDIPSEAIQENHRGMMARAEEALEEQAVTQRHFNSLTLQFDPKLLPLAKQRLSDFIRQFNEEFNQDSSESVYQLNLQFFEHTQQGLGHDN